MKNGNYHRACGISVVSFHVPRDLVYSSRSTAIVGAGIGYDRCGCAGPDMLALAVMTLGVVCVCVRQTWNTKKKERKKEKKKEREKERK
jgi:hypothetical protein